MVVLLLTSQPEADTAAEHMAAHVALEEIAELPDEVATEVEAAVAAGRRRSTRQRSDRLTDGDGLTGETSSPTNPFNRAAEEEREKDEEERAQDAEEEAGTAAADSVVVA